VLRGYIIGLVAFVTIAIAKEASNEALWSEDSLIMHAIVYDEYEQYAYSYPIYRQLYDQTREDIYLFKEVKSALFGEIPEEYTEQTIKRLKILEQRVGSSVEIQRLLLPMYLRLRDYERASIEGERLLGLSNDVVDLDLASSALIYQGKIDRAFILLNHAYKLDPKEHILLRIVEILDEFMKRRDEAIQLLEMHSRIYYPSVKLYQKLLLLYQKERNIEGILSTYKMMYSYDKKEEYLEKIIDTYIYKRDMQGVTAFLEKEQQKPKILYELYKIQKMFDKAINLIDHLYESDKDAKWLAEKGVLIFETADDKDDRQMLHRALGYLERAIHLGNDDSIYLNYYGYTLIDKEIDIAKGMKVIREALLQQPDNTYYLDSLAWGYYKSNECAKAYHLMKRVVDKEGLDEEEIIRHWSAIQECK
jgi:tetratricopeptide (TPR) repeat protein